MLFFTYQSDLPPQVGFSLYSPAHLATLVLLVCLCALCAKRFRASAAAVQQRVTRALGLLLLLWELLRTAVYWHIGFMGVGELPLHLCGLAVFLCFFHSLWSADWLGQVLYALCLPGTCAALLFPDWTMYPFFSFVSLHAFAAHGLLVLYIVMQTASGRIVPRLSALWKPVLFLCAVVPPVALFNRHFHTNYMFLSLPSPGSPLVALSEWAGGTRAGYLCLFAALIFAVMVLMELPFARAARHK